MRILIDGDACPVIDITEEIARKHNIELIIYTDISHQIKSDYGQVFSLDSANQSVDMALYNKCKAGDLVITQDYGLAALVLGKGARAINEFGREYTDENIDHLLMKRHIHSRMRRAGKRHASHSKRKQADDMNFKRALLTLLSQN